MSHSSGIPVTPELADAFGKARSAEAGVRYIRVVIRDDKLQPDGTFPLSDSLEADLEKVREHLQPKVPLYVLFRLDTTNDLGYEWMLIAYVPDGSPVRERMLYASTRDLLKKQLGSSAFSDDLYGSSKEDITVEAFHDLKNKHKHEAPLTATEMQLKSELTAHVEVGTTRQYVHSVQFPLSAEAQDKIRALAGSSTAGGVNFVQLSVDTTRETIELAGSKKLASPADIAAQIPSNEPRFNLFKWEHTHDDTAQAPVVFIYSCANDSPIKQRMLYSTVKAAVTGACEQLGLKIEKRFEINDADEVSEQFLSDELHPKAAAASTGFARPTRPGKGAPRLIRKK